MEVVRDVVDVVEAPVRLPVGEPMGAVGTHGMVVAEDEVVGRPIVRIEYLVAVEGQGRARQAVLLVGERALSRGEVVQRRPGTQPPPDVDAGRRFRVAVSDVVEHALAPILEPLQHHVFEERRLFAPFSAAARGDVQHGRVVAVIAIEGPVRAGVIVRVVARQIGVQGGHVVAKRLERAGVLPRVAELLARGQAERTLLARNVLPVEHPVLHLVERRLVAFDGRVDRVAEEGVGLGYLVAVGHEEQPAAVPGLDREAEEGVAVRRGLDVDLVLVGVVPEPAVDPGGRHAIAHTGLVEKGEIVVVVRDPYSGIDRELDGTKTGFLFGLGIVDGPQSGGLVSLQLVRVRPPVRG